MPTITPTRTGTKVPDEINKEENDNNTNTNAGDDTNDNADSDSNTDRCFCSCSCSCDCQHFLQASSSVLLLVFLSVLLSVFSFALLSALQQAQSDCPAPAQSNAHRWLHGSVCTLQQGSFKMLTFILVEPRPSIWFFQQGATLGSQLFLIGHAKSFSKCATFDN